MSQPAPEFSRTVTLAEIGNRPLTRRYAAKPEECAALARRFDLPAIARLEAEVTVEPVRREYHLSGRIVADLTQVSVVSLEPFDSTLDEAFELRLSPDAPSDEEALEMMLDPNAEEPPEPLEGDRIDLGEIVAQHLSLALDPNPRAPGETFEGFSEEGGAEPEKPANPFAKLADWQRNR
ncbi:MAG TPA: DUF177 domain-containing protein [Alphaproteobacteria bacterium]|nr:DUF177 domain-containing protein [Alphaproteobacteria bacterium]